MGGTRSGIEHLTRTLLPLSPRFGSKEHELKAGHTPTTRHCTVSDGGTPDYFSFNHHSLILHMFALHCNIRVKYCRPGWKKRGGNGRRWNRGWRPIVRGWCRGSRPSHRGSRMSDKPSSRCLNGCKVLARGWVNLCHRPIPCSTSSYWHSREYE